MSLPASSGEPPPTDTMAFGAVRGERRDAVDDVLLDGVRVDVAEDRRGDAARLEERAHALGDARPSPRRRRTTTSARVAPMRFTWSRDGAHGARAEDDGGREAQVTSVDAGVAAHGALQDVQSGDLADARFRGLRSDDLEVAAQLPVGDGALVLAALPVARAHVVVDEGLAEDGAGVLAPRRGGRSPRAACAAGARGRRGPRRRRRRAAAARFRARCPRGRRRAWRPWRCTG